MSTVQDILSEKEKDHIHITLIRVYCYNHAILLLILFVNLLLSLIYELSQLCIQKNIVYIGLVLYAVSGIHCQSGYTSPLNKGEIAVFGIQMDHQVFPLKSPPNYPCPPGLIRTQRPVTPNLSRMRVGVNSRGRLCRLGILLVRDKEKLEWIMEEEDDEDWLQVYN